MVAKIRNVIGLIGFILSLSGGVAIAQSCALAGIDPSAFSSGTLLLRTNVGWTTFDATRDVKGYQSRWYSFAYIIKAGEPDRSGAIVVKTGDQQPVAEQQPIQKRVLLVRRPGVTSYCPPNSRLIWSPVVARYVSVEAYEAYHNYAAVDSPHYLRHERDFKTFHTQYRAQRLDRCITTNDAEYYIPSNLSQFSFAPAVVQNDTIGVIRALTFLVFSPSAAYASAGVVNMRSEVRQYRTVSGAACVRLGLQLNERSFVRINDLENRPLIPLVLREQEWKP